MEKIKDNELLNNLSNEVHKYIIFSIIQEAVENGKYKEYLDKLLESAPITIIESKNYNDINNILNSVVKVRKTYNKNIFNIQSEVNNIFGIDEGYRTNTWNKKYEVISSAGLISLKDNNKRILLYIKNYYTGERITLRRGQKGEILTIINDEIIRNRNDLCDIDLFVDELSINLVYYPGYKSEDRIDYNGLYKKSK